MQGTSPADLIHQLVDSVAYEEHLKKTQSDWESRWENVQELITFASDVHDELGQHESEPKDEERDEDYEDDDEPEEGNSNTPLRLFLQASMLSSEGDKTKEGEVQEVCDLASFQRFSSRD